MRHHLPRPAAFALTALLLVAACSPAPASPSPSIEPVPESPSPSSGASLAPDAGAIYRDIAAQVSAIRQLDASDRVEPVVIDGPTLLRNLKAEFDKTNSPAEIATEERILQLLGLLPPDASLAKLYLDLQGNQVIGYYDATVNQLFIVSRDGNFGALGEATYAHEFAHELQDRHFDLESLGLDTIKDDSDRLLAILSLVEGDAVSVQTSWMFAHLTPERLGEVAAQASDPAMLQVLASTPRILIETSLFPYQSGATFVGRLQAENGYAAVDAAYKRLPESTEQILHPDAYLEGEAPIQIAVPSDLATRLGAGWLVRAGDTIGEFQMRVWLREGGVPGDVARLAAEGWGGDRLTILTGEGDGAVATIVWITAWDSAADASEFAAAAATAVGGLGLDAEMAASGTRVVLGIRSGPTPTGATLRSIVEGLARG